MEETGLNRRTKLMKLKLKLYSTEVTATFLNGRIKEFLYIVAEDTKSAHDLAIRSFSSFQEVEVVNIQFLADINGYGISTQLVLSDLIIDSLAKNEAINNILK